MLLEKIIQDVNFRMVDSIFAWAKNISHFLMYRNKVLIMIISLICLLSSCTNTSSDIFSKNIVIMKNTDFVTSKITNIKSIKAVKYYWATANSWGVGPAPVQFCGIIEVEEKYINHIFKKYDDWERDNEPSNEAILGNEQYEFWYSDDFDRYVDAPGFVGCFYIEKNRNLIYFTGEY